MDLLADRQRMTHDEKVLLILEVQASPCLYDAKHDEYKNPVVRQEAWDLIAKSLGRSSNECCEVWRNMRDTFKKSKGKTTKQTYKYAPYMTFLAEALHQQQQPVACSSQQLVEPPPDPDELRLKVGRAKRARLAKRVAAFVDAADAEEQQAEDPFGRDSQPPTSDKVFGQLVACELQSMPEGAEKLDLKTRITKLIYETKYPHDNTSSPSVDERCQSNNGALNHSGGGGGLAIGNAGLNNSNGGLNGSTGGMVHSNNVGLTNGHHHHTTPKWPYVGANQ